MLAFCDESWKENQAGKKIGTLAAVAIERDAYNAIADRIFLLAQKYWGFEKARKYEIKGRKLINAYEFRRVANGGISMKLSFAREILEELRSLDVKVFASVVYAEKDVELLCEDPERLDRPYFFLIERIHEYLLEKDTGTASITFDDRGTGINARVSYAYSNFMTRSRTGRSYNKLLRHPFFAYSDYSRGIQIADLICTVVCRYHTNKESWPGIWVFYEIVRAMEWVASAPNETGYALRGIKVIGR